MVDQSIGRLIAEVMRLQRWVGQDAINGATLFGLLNGFESVRDKIASNNISEDTQTKVEDVLQELDQGEGSYTSLWLKGRLDELGVDESTACTIMEFCKLDSRFGDVVDKIKENCGGTFRTIGMPEQESEANWYGPMQYIEVVGSPDGSDLRTVFSASVPRAGDVVAFVGESKMEVTHVEYLGSKRKSFDGNLMRVLVPYVHLAPLEDEAPDDNSAG